MYITEQNKIPSLLELDNEETGNKHIIISWVVIRDKKKSKTVLRIEVMRCHSDGKVREALSHWVIFKQTPELN